jgi:serine/threonine protein kinase
MGTTTPTNRVDDVEELIRTHNDVDGPGPGPMPGPITAPTGPVARPSPSALIGAPPPVRPSLPHDTMSEPTVPRVSRALPVELRAGTLVGEYEVNGKLGQGGMGVVYSATHPVIGKKAALKVLRKNLCADVEAVERFIQEARAVNQIGHPNIVDIFAFGTLSDERSYLVMELLTGESLQQRLRRAPLQRDELCHYGDAIARALEAAHNQRIIHRDLKPENVFLHEVRGERPMVKLLDFGIAKLTDTDDNRAGLTRTGAMMGTPQYISPEQARGYAIDYRADIYSLGVMLFEMAAGRPPFAADNAMDMVARHLYEAPPRLSAASPDAPHALDELIASMLDKDPARRPTLVRVREVLAEIARPSYRDHTQPDIRMPTHVTAPRVIVPETTGRTPERRKSGKGPIIVVLAGLIALVGGLIAFVAVKAMRKDAKPAAAPVALAPADPAALPAPAAAPGPGPAAAPDPGPAAAPDPATATAAAAATTGSVVVELSGSSRGTLLVDGERHSTASRWELTLPLGAHELEVRAKGYETWTQRVDITAGAEPRAIDAALERKRRAAPETGRDRTTPTRVDDDDDDLMAPKSPTKGSR